MHHYNSSTEYFSQLSYEEQLDYISFPCYYFVFLSLIAILFREFHFSPAPSPHPLSFSLSLSPLSLSDSIYISVGWFDIIPQYLGALFRFCSFFYSL